MASEVNVPASIDLDGIAIIGMACRFPGAPDLASYWRNLCEGRESVTFFSRAELEAAGVPSSLLDAPGYVPAAPVLEGVDQFDAGFFSYSAREATLMDPQQRLLLEVAWECFENAGYRPDALEAPVGVFAGSGGVVTSYLTALQQRSPELLGPTGSLQHIGNDKDFLSTRISFKLDLRGPSVNVQTACSTSLVALHLACRSLLDGECDLALAGAATVRVPHQAGYQYQSEDILSPDGHCRAFDEAAQGTIFGSGVGAVLLKPLRAAIEAGDHVYAVIKGSAINNDGARKVSYTASSVPGQARAMVEAMTMAGFSPDSIGYVECHATGTTVGDPLEVQALTRAFRTGTDRVGFCGIGSVKSNIGHLEQTAGMAALIKTALALSHKQLPPTVNFQKANPKLGLATSPFYVQTQLTDWHSPDAPRRAALNGLGLGGTNAFVMLQEAPARSQSSSIEATRPAQVLALSARNEAALRASAGRLGAHLTEHPELNLADVCLTASTSRTGFQERLAISARSTQELAERLNGFARGEQTVGASSGNARSAGLVFLFTGQGAQYPGMARALYGSEPVFRDALERCDALSRPHLERSLLSVLFGLDPAAELINETEYTQVCLFAVEYSLFCLWRSWGVEPEVVMGHSVGELVALCVAGALELDDALKLVAWRGRLMQSLPRDGGMAAVFASEEAVLERLRPFGERLSIAAVNAPNSVVVSGELSALRAFLDSLTEPEISAKELVVSHAFHSASMDPILNGLEQVASSLTLQAPRLKVVSNLTGELHTEAPSPRYFREHARGAVRFAHSLQQLHAAGYRRFIEVGPGSSLLGLGRQTLGASDISWLPSLSRNRPDFEVMADTLRELFVKGHEIAWAEVARGQGKQRVPLPTYPFQRKRYWVSERAHQPTTGTPGAHPLLGSRRRSSLKDAEFEAYYGLSELGYLDDHRIFGLPVLPTTAALEAIGAGARRYLGVERVRIEQFLYREALVLPEEGTRLLHLVFSPDGDGRCKLRLLSTEATTNAAWILHIEADVETDTAPVAPPRDLAGLRASCPRPVPVERYYPAIRAFGLEYGAAFRGIRELWQGEAQALSRVVLPDAVDSTPYALQPAFLDACLHIYPALAEAHADFSAPVDDPSRSFLPISLERVQVFQPGKREAWVHAVRRAGATVDAMTIDITLLDDAGAEIAVLEGLLVRRLNKEAMQPSSQELSPLFDSMYQVAWEERPLAPPTPREEAPGRWLVFADQGGVGTALAEELRARGQDCQVVLHDAVKLGGREVSLDPDQPAMFHRLVRDYFGVPGVSYRNVVYLWGLDAPPALDLDLDTLTSAERRASGSALLVSQAVAVVNSVTGASPRLWLATRNAQGPAQGNTVELTQAPLWALGSAMARRYAELWGGMIDLERREQADPKADAQALLSELWQSDGEDQIVLRQGKRLVPRLSRIAKSEPRLHGPLFRADATYLVAGGLGQTGLRIADWLATGGAKHLVLVDTAKLTDDRKQAIAALAARSVDVRVLHADITNATDVGALFRELSSLPTLKGIWHCAGTRGDDVFDLIQWRKFAHTTAPRLRGAWLLHQHSAQLKLEHFAVLSSAVSWLGSETRTNEASAGAFLEALVRLRRAQGLPASIVHLGPLASAPAPLEAGAQGLEALEQATAFEALDYLARRDVERAAVGKISWPTLLQAYKGGAPPLYSTIGKGRLRTRKAQQSSEDPRLLRERLRKADANERRPLLLEIVRQQVTDVLGAEELIDTSLPLVDFGLDSLISVNLVNRLEPVLGVSVPLAKLLQGATVERLVDDCLVALSASLVEAA